MNMQSQDTFSSLFEKLDDESKTRLASHFFNLMQIFVGQTHAILNDQDLTTLQAYKFMQKELHDFLEATQDVIASEYDNIEPQVLN